MAKSKSSGVVPLLYAAVFMLVGILILIKIASVPPRLRNAPLTDIDLKPLVNASDTPSMKDLRGKVVVVHFWGTWCGPCRYEYPEFAQVYQQFANDENVKFLSVSCSPGAENNLAALATETEEYLKSLNSSMPIYADPVGFTRGKVASDLLNELAYPTTLVLDQNGIVRDAWIGADTSKMKKLPDQIRKMKEQVATG
jgi:thiol-disulfide isomerase/thioredoxin